MIRRGSLFALIVSAPFVWVACNIIFSIDPPELVTDAAPADTGGDDVVVDTGCVSARWPAPPKADDPGGSDVEVFAAIRTLRFAFNPSDPPGYDLDNRCTCPDKDSCIRPAGARARCDELGGRDLAMNRELLGFVERTPGFGEVPLNDGLERGRFGALVQIKDWNGKPNDTQVSVAIYLSPGIEGRADAGADVRPGWDGGDKWELDPTSLDGPVTDAGPRPKYVDTTAYVVNNVLVAAQLEGTRLSLGEGSGTAELHFKQTVLTAEIVERPGKGWALDKGIIAARWPVNNMLQAIAHLSISGDGGGPICKSPLLYAPAKAAICNGADISLNPARDDGTLPCGAMSLGMSFTAEPATWGSVRSKFVPDSGCGEFRDECLETGP